jgi:type I restriction enzyme S subunit
MEKLEGKKPLIRFPEFKDAWEHKKLSELLSESKKRNEDLKFGKDEVLSVSGEFGIVNQIKHLGRSYAGVSVHQYHVVETGDIVYTKSPLKENPYGIIKMNRGKAGIVSTLYAVYNVQEENADGAFVEFYFSLDANTNRYLRPLVKKGAKNDMKINNAYVLHDRIFAPTRPEQKRIASFFTVLDKKISELKQKKRLLEKYKTGVLQKIFKQELRFKDSTYKDFPKWETLKLGEIAKFRRGSFPQPYGLEKWYDDENGFPFIQVFDVDDNMKLKPDTKRKISAEAQKQSVFVKKGSILLTIQGSIGRIAITEYEAYVDRTLLLFESFKISMDKYYFMYAVFLLFEIEKMKAPGGTIKTITKEVLTDFKIPVPSFNEQTRIANFLISIDAKINRTQLQVEKTEKYKKGLLQNMFC